MSNSFLQLINSKEVNNLIYSDTNLFKIVHSGASTVQRYEGKKLNIGESYVGNCKHLNLTREEYEQALKRGVKKGYFQIIRRSRIDGTVIKICSEKVFNLNIYQTGVKESESIYEVEQKIVQMPKKETLMMLNRIDEKELNLGSIKTSIKVMGGTSIKVSCSSEDDSDTSTKIIFDNKHQNNFPTSIKGSILKEYNIESYKKKNNKKKKPASPMMKISFDVKDGFKNIQPEQLENWKVRYPYSNIEEQIKECHNWVLRDITRNMRDNWSITLCIFFSKDNERKKNIAIAKEQMESLPIQEPQSKKQSPLIQHIKSNFKNGMQIGNTEINFNDEFFGCALIIGHKAPRQIELKYSKADDLNNLLKEFHVNDPKLLMP